MPTNTDSQIHYPPYAKPSPGEVVEIQPGLLWLRMPLPFALDHINLWLIRDEFEGAQGWCAVDTGVALIETQEAWRQVLAHPLLEGLPLTRLICTHMHPDHMGLAAWLCEGLPTDMDRPEQGRWRVPLFMTLGEYSTGRMFVSRAMGKETEGLPDGPESSNLAHFVRHGMQAPEDQEKTQARKDHFTRLVPRLPLRYRRLLGGQRIFIGSQTWTIIPGYGHSPEHAALYCDERRVLISGDMVLPRISTNVSAWGTEPDADAVGLFLESLEHFDGLPYETLVLPSHGQPFGGKEGRSAGLHLRLDQLRAHHAQQLEVTRAHFENEGESQVIGLIPKLFSRRLDMHQLSFAMGEAVAHANCLWHRGVLDRRVLRQADGTERITFRMAAQAAS